ncbi:hypothetical protein [Cupriavidus nantongensis]
MLAGAFKEVNFDPTAGDWVSRAARLIAAETAATLSYALMLAAFVCGLADAILFSQVMTAA